MALRTAVDASGVSPNVVASLNITSQRRGSISPRAVYNHMESIRQGKPIMKQPSQMPGKMDSIPEVPSSKMHKNKTLDPRKRVSLLSNNKIDSATSA